MLGLSNIKLRIAGLTYTVFPPSGESPSNKEVRDAINAKCREVKFACQTKAGVQAFSRPGGSQED